jgi:putative restriction endonuclease
LAVACRPDFLGTYAANLEALHDTGEVPSEVNLLARIADEPDAVPEEQIAAEVAAPRQFAVTQTRRALRALDFSDRVMTAYGRQCAMCGIQLELLDGAHILPVAEPDSTDETSNGIALCALHHRAYDRSLVTFAPDYRVHINEERVGELPQSDLVGKLDEFRGMLRDVIHLPPQKSDRPNPDYVGRANQLRRWIF